MKHLIIIICISFCLSACEEKVDWPLNLADAGLVVDAIITSEFKAQEIYVYKTLVEAGYAVEPISNATILIGTGSTVYPCLPASDEPGLYLSTPFAATVNNVYWLIIEHESRRDTALAQMVPISPINDDVIVQDSGLFQLYYGGSSTPSMTEYLYDWSNNPAYCENYGSCYAGQTYYSIGNIDLMEEYGPTKQEIFFPANTQIIRRKYSLSANHQQFVRSLLIETQWRGGLFDMEQGNVPSNFSQGTRGWFGACMVINDTIWVN